MEKHQLSQVNKTQVRAVKRREARSGMGAHTFNPGTREAEAGGSLLMFIYRVVRETLSQ